MQLESAAEAASADSQSNEQSMHAPRRLVLLAAPAPMPDREPERSTEAIRRSLRQLWKLDRYERRAGARRDGAARALIKCLKNEGLDQ
jgi:hypothetical protein